MTHPAPAGPGDATVRVCHIIHSLRPGGAEHLLLTLAEAAPAAGLEVSVISLMPDEGLRYASALRELGVTVHSLALPTRWDVRGLLRATKLVAAIAPDIIHTHLKHADLVGAFASRRLGIPMVSTLHVIEDAPRPVQRFKRRIAAQARLRGANMTIAVSHAQRHWYLETFDADPQRVTTLHNGVLTPGHDVAQDRERTRRRLGIPATAIMASVISIMREGKGHLDVLEAVRQVPVDSDVRLVLAGDGPLLPSLRAIVQTDETLRERVVLPGFVEDVEGLLAASDLVIQPSHFDALPTSLIYGLAAGTPAIGTNVGGIPEILGDDAGILVPPGDHEVLADAIMELARDAERREALSTAARERFLAEFEAGRWASRLREIYASVLEGGS